MEAQHSGAAELHGLDLASIAASGTTQLCAVQDLSWRIAHELVASASSHLSNCRLSRYQQQRHSGSQPFQKLKKVTRHSLKELYGNVEDVSVSMPARRPVLPSLKPQVFAVWQTDTLAL